MSRRPRLVPGAGAAEDEGAGLDLADLDPGARAADATRPESTVPEGGSDGSDGLSN